LCNKDTQRNKWSTSRKGGERQRGADKSSPSRRDLPEAIREVISGKF